MTARQRILIVDDETKVAFFLRESLETLGHNFEVLSASSPEEALRQVSLKKFDLLVTDQRMPGMNGLDLIRQVQESHPETQFILITAYGTDNVLTQAQRLGAYRYFTKPFHIEDFVQTVLDALQERAGSQPLDPWSDAPIDVLRSRLEELRREIGAQCVLASASHGTLIAQAGVLAGLDMQQLLSLAADGCVTSAAMSHYLGGDHISNLNYFEGKSHDIYTANVHDDLFIVIVFDRRMQASRIGIVWLYVRRAIESLRRVVALSTPEKREADAQDTPAKKTLRDEPVRSRTGPTN
jgi:CheY-like chemotaxis protein/predicted regulator of Ras-like GTPase activity (Roadblock/LC7/MglB family)